MIVEGVAIVHPQSSEAKIVLEIFSGKTQHHGASVSNRCDEKIGGN
jgi:hypothetical protein